MTKTKFKNINPVIRVLLVIIIVILFLFGLVLGVFAIRQCTISVRTDDGISYDEVKENIEDRFVPNQAEWSEFESVEYGYKGYDNIISNNHDYICFDLLYDANNDIYVGI